MKDTNTTIKTTIQTLEVLEKGYTLVDMNGQKVIMKAGKIISEKDYADDLAGKRRNGFEWLPLTSNEINDILDFDGELIKLWDKDTTDGYGQGSTVSAMHIAEEIEDSYIIIINSKDGMEDNGRLRHLMGAGDIAYQLDKHRPEKYDEFVESQLKSIGMTYDQYKQLPYKNFKGYEFFSEWIHDGKFYKVTKRNGIFYKITEGDEVDQTPNVGRANTNEAKESATRARFV